MVPPQQDGAGFGTNDGSLATRRLIDSVIAALAFAALSVCAIVLLAVSTQASLALPSLTHVLPG